MSIILAIDIGNTNTSIGIYDKDKLTDTFRLSSDKKKTIDEYGILLCTFLNHKNLNAMNKTIHRNDLDILKGISIIAVVLYHMGLAPGGYLGVDVFLVINVFLIVPKVVSAIEEDTFQYLAFLEKRIVRLLPLSQDCRHLTQAGAKFFAGQVDFESIFNGCKDKINKLCH